MSNGTQITIVGNVTEDPELRFTPAGVAVVKFSVAVNRRKFDRELNQWVDAGTDFHRVSAWRDLAQNIVESITKGTRVLVLGELQMRQWTPDGSDERRTAWELEALAVGPELSFAMAKVMKIAKHA